MSKEYSWDILRIINYINIPVSRKIFEKYISKIYSSISESSKNEMNTNPELNIISFTHYLNLPLFISEKIFNSIQKSKEKEINREEFINYLSTLYFGTLEEKAKLIFKIIDFDDDNYITIEDAKLLSYHFHIFKNVYKDDLDLELINEIINGIFERDKKLNYNEYIKRIKMQNSDIFFLYLMFFFKFKPFTINELKLFEKNYHLEKHLKYKLDTKDIFNIYPLIQPTKNLFYYYKKYLQIETKFTDEESENEDEKILNDLKDFENDFKKIKSNFNLPKDKSSFRNSVFSAPKLSQQNLFQLNQSLSIENHFVNCKTISNEKYYSFHSECKLGNRKNISDFEKDNIPYKKVNLYLTGNCLFSYEKIIENNENNNEKHYHERHYEKLKLFVLKKVLEIEEADNIVLICYIIGLNPKIIELNFPNEKIKSKFLKAIIQETNFKKVKDYYEIEEKIGKGGFGKIFSGKNKKNNKKVAIKCIEKNYSTPIEEQSYFFWELSICKTIKNIEAPYFIKIYDIFESLSHVYAIMEFGEEDFETNLSKNWPNLNLIYDYVKQIANGILTLNKFGIMHRDLKIENLIISYENNNDINDETNYELKPILKLIDFGLSKIIGYHESTNETYGTLFYVSPEIIEKKTYNYKEDVWSFGVICYFLLCKKMPFLEITNDFMKYSKNTQFDIIKKNIEEKNVYLDENDFSETKAKILVKVINMSLIRDINKRAWIQDIVKLLNDNLN